MKKLVLFALLISAFAFSAFGQKSKADPAKDVRAVFDRLIEGIKQVDVEKVMSVYEKSDRTLFFNNNGSATLGWQTMFDNRKNLYENTANVTLETTGVRVEILSPTSAYVSCKWKQTQEYKGKLETASGRMTLVLKKIGKDWKVVHLHTSPDNPDPNRPVLPSERENADLTNKEVTNSVSTRLLFASFEQNLSLAKYKKLKKGMSYGEVVSVLGREGKKISKTAGQGEESQVFKWDDEGDKLVLITFVNNKLMYKTQANLK